MELTSCTMSKERCRVVMLVVEWREVYKGGGKYISAVVNVERVVDLQLWHCFW